MDGSGTSAPRDDVRLALKVCACASRACPSDDRRLHARLHGAPAVYSNLGHGRTRIALLRLEANGAHSKEGPAPRTASGRKAAACRAQRPVGSAGRC